MPFAALWLFDAMSWSTVAIARSKTPTWVGFSAVLHLTDAGLAFDYQFRPSSPSSCSRAGYREGCRKEPSSHPKSGKKQRNGWLAGYRVALNSWRCRVSLYDKHFSGKRRREVGEVILSFCISGLLLWFSRDWMDERMGNCPMPDSLASPTWGLVSPFIMLFLICQFWTQGKTGH